VRTQRVFTIYGTVPKCLLPGIKRNMQSDEAAKANVYIFHSAVLTLHAYTLKDTSKSCQQEDKH